MLAGMMLVATGQIPVLPGQYSPLDEQAVCGRTGGRCQEGRTSARYNDFAFFEFAPAGGAGMNALCACVNPTGAKGEVLTMARTGNATCAKGGISTTITDGDYVVCGSNLVRVEQQSDGVKAIRMEAAATNTLIRSAEICNAAWADVGTPSCTSDQATGPFGTTTMDRFDDNDVGAYEGRSQAITTSSLTHHTVSCRVKAGTATSASITLVGTGNAAGDCSQNITGLSTTTSSVLTCSSFNAYAAGLTGVTVTVRVGSTVAVTGTIFVEACDHVVSAPFLTSHIPTAGTSVTRNTEDVYATVTNLSDTKICMAGTFEPLWSTSTFSANATGIEPTWGGPSTLLQVSAGSANPWIIASASRFTTFTPGLQRAVAFDDGVNVSIKYGTITNTAAAGAPSDRFGPNIRMGSGLSGSPLNGLVSRVQVDPSPTRCQ